MLADRLKHGASGWTELNTSDVPAEKEFYKSLLGWQMEDIPMEGTTCRIPQAP